MLKLIIEDDEGRKTVVPFVRDEITIGRQEGNTIRLTERNVSRRHARLLRQNGHVLVEDLGSYNGVRINGERIQGQAQVGDGDLIQIGDYDLALQKESTAQTSAPTVRLPAAAVQAALDELPDRSEEPEADPEQELEAEALEAAEPQEEEPAPAAPRRQSTAVIRMDQVEANRPRKVQALEPDEAPRLVVVSAEFQGQEFSCIRTEMRVGRTDDNDIALDHRSLSRTHAKIVREDNGEWRVIDMQSANGLTVNGESYAQAPISHGDLIELGHVKLRFIGPGQSTDGLLHDGTAKRSKKGLVVAVAVVLLGALGGAAWFLLGQSPAPAPQPQPSVVEKQPEPPRQPAQPPDTQQAAQNPAPATDPQQQAAADKAQLEQKRQAAQAALDAHEFDKAVDTLEAIPSAQRPPEAEELLTRARTEQQALKNLGLAQKELDANRPAEAQKYLEAAATTTLLTTEYTKLKQQVDAALAPPAPTPAPTPVKPVATRPGNDTARAQQAQAEAKQLIDDSNVLIRKQQYPEAETKLNKCIALEPPHPRCYFMLGVIAARKNRMEEGARYYREFLRLAPNDPMAPGVTKVLEDYEKTQKKTPGGGK